MNHRDGSAWLCLVLVCNRDTVRGSSEAIITNMGKRMTRIQYAQMLYGHNKTTNYKNVYIFHGICWKSDSVMTNTNSGKR